MSTKDFADLFVECFVPNVDANLFIASQVKDELRVDLRHGFVLSGEADSVGSWPGQPCGEMGFPLSGHPITKFQRGVGAAHDRVDKSKTTSLAMARREV